MLTCNIGETKVNTIDHSESDIRKWSNKKILRRPICGAEMIYKNGKIKVAHFAHKGEDCLLKYNEVESKEHLDGKMIIYEWLKKQNVDNLELESWIPETKQRPDLYFELNGEKYVIEYQCSPISSEYIERHELYEMAGINDIWILGTEKYNIQIDFVNTIGGMSQYIKTKTIERELYYSDNNIYYLNGKSIINVVGFEYSDRQTIFKCFIDYVSDINEISIIEIINKNKLVSKEKDVIELYKYAESKCKLLTKKSKRTYSDKVKYYANNNYDKITITRRYGEIETEVLYSVDIYNCSFSDFDSIYEKEILFLRLDNKKIRIEDNIVFKSKEFDLLKKTKETLNSMKREDGFLKYKSYYEITNNLDVFYSIECNEDILYRFKDGNLDLNLLKRIFAEQSFKIEKENDLLKTKLRKQYGGYSNETKK